MSLEQADLQILKNAEALADNAWKRVARWGPFARDVVGKHLAEAADSIGANLALAYGRVHGADKLACLYLARGSLFETKYWLNRAHARELLEAETVEAYALELADLARQLNALTAEIRGQRESSRPSAALREPNTEYQASDQAPPSLFTSEDLVWLAQPGSPPGTPAAESPHIPVKE